jgi:hypothetical protein
VMSGLSYALRRASHLPRMWPPVRRRNRGAFGGALVIGCLMAQWPQYGDGRVAPVAPGCAGCAGRRMFLCALHACKVDSPS